jgi:hypothetical protein
VSVGCVAVAGAVAAGPAAGAAAGFAAAGASAGRNSAVAVRTVCDTPQAAGTPTTSHANAINGQGVVARDGEE